MELGLGGIAGNHNLTLDFIEKHIDKPWSWDYVSNNSFKIDYENELKKLMFEKYHEELIQKTWHPSRFQEWCLDEEEKNDIQ